MPRPQFKFLILKFVLKVHLVMFRGNLTCAQEKENLGIVCVGRSRQCDKRYSKRMLLTRADKFRHKTRWGKSKYV